MPRHCSAGGCKSRDNRETRKAGITFHKLPKGASRRNLWITNSHRKGLWDPQTDFVYFCSKHFTPESFELTGYSGIRRLREDAFPTVFDASLEPKRKGPGRPRKRDAIYLRKKTQAQVAVQDMIQDDNMEAETAKEEEVLNLTPLKEEQEKEEGRKEEQNEAASETENISLQDACPSPPVPQQSPLLEHPVSPSRYMRRLPPPPGFYLPKEHSYAQLCPLLWRRRYERAMDCLEKALRQLSAARRRENRLRTTLLRLREKRLRRAPQDDGQKTKRDWLASGQSRVAVGRAGGDGSFLIQQEEGEFDMDAEESAFCENACPEPTDWARCFGLNTFSQEEPGEYCFNCNRAGERHFARDTRPVSSAMMNKNARSVLRNGILTSQEEGCKWIMPVKPPGSHKDMLTNSECKALRETHELQFCSAGVVESIDNVQLVVLEGPHGDGLHLHLQSALKLPTSPSLLQTSAHVGLQQVILDGESLRKYQVQNLQPALSDFGARGGQPKGAQSYKELCQQVFFVQERTEGQLLLVPVTTQDGLKGVDRTEDRSENVQTILEPQITFHPDLGPITEDEQSQVIETSAGNIINTVVREDVREKLKEHLEGFQLQLSNEYIT